MIATFAHLISIASALPADASALESAISALVREITTLESRSEFWEKSLPWFTGLVVLGLVADVVVIIWERKEEVATYRRWVYQGFHPAERPSRWNFTLELIASAAILLGVAGELWAGAAIASVNGQLRSKNAELRDKSNQLVALVTQEAGDAAKSAKTAREEADAVKGIADEARADAKDALAKAQTAQHELAKAESDAGKAQLEASDALNLARSGRNEANSFKKKILSAEQELENLKNRMADRILTPAQQTAIASRLIKYGPRRIDVLIIGSTGEITGITNMILAALVQARWTVGNSASALGVTASGIFVGTVKGAPPDTEETVSILITALQGAGLATNRLPSYDDKVLPAALAGTWDTNNTAPIRIVIGAKP